MTMNTLQRLQLTTLGPIFGLVALSVLAFVNQNALNRAQANRYESYQLAHELRASSDELTRMARTYVVTDDPAYEQAYWHILDVRNGIKPRPDGRTVSLRRLMQHQGFTAAEFAKLKQAEDNSNALVATETIAMHAMKGEFDDGVGGFTRKGEPDRELAQRIMHDEKYHDDKGSIMDPIGEFEEMLDRRTDVAVSAARTRSDRLMLLVIGLAALAAVIAWLSIRRHARSLRLAIDDLANTSEYVASGAAQVAAASRSHAAGSIASNGRRAATSGGPPPGRCSPACRWRCSWTASRRARRRSWPPACRTPAGPRSWAAGPSARAPCRRSCPSPMAVASSSSRRPNTCGPVARRSTAAPAPATTRPGA
jgi:hypothetical protein